jgi:hypothetical protein
MNGAHAVQAFLLKLLFVVLHKRNVCSQPNAVSVASDGHSLELVYTPLGAAAGFMCD